jgi:hypothetical protein
MNTNKHPPVKHTPLSNNLSELSGGQVSNHSITTEKLLQSAIHHKTMKTEYGKTNKTKKYIPYNHNHHHNHHNHNQSKNDNGNISKAKYKKKKTRYSLKRHPDYLEKLINTFYDNDKCVSKYLSTAHRKLHALPPARRIIVIGDIHGDFDVAVKCLILAGCIAPINSPEIKSIENMDAFYKSLIWTGGDTQVVQLGDQIDRVRPRRWDSNSISQTEAHEDEGTTLEIFYLFWHLNQLAQKAQPLAGAVHCIIGNHEIMNVEGDFSYVSSAEFNSFKNHLTHVYYPNSKYPYHSRTLKKTRETRKSKGLPVGYRERLYAFSPTGICSNFMAQNYYTLLQIGNWLFCHGSPTLSTFATYEIDLINTITSMYLLGLDSSGGTSIEYHFDKIMNNDSSAREPTSLIWSRTFGEIQPTQSEYKLEALLDKILATYNEKNNITSSQNKATHIAIGHTPQIHDNKQLGINSICNERVWRCDVGMSKAFINKANNSKDNTNINKTRKIQVLEIVDGKPHILSNF